MRRGRYKIKTIAELTGFSPTLLRAWERRYEVLVPERTASGHRLYTSEDLQVLEAIRQRLEAGRSIGEVVQEGRETLLRGHQGEATPVAPASDPTSSPESLNQRLLQAARELDEVALQRLLDQTFSSLTASTALADVLEATCVQMGELWGRGEASVAHEHLLSSVLSRRMQRLLDFAGPTSGPVALAACVPDEQHELGLMMVTYRLRSLGVGAICLGRGLPLEDLLGACRTRQASHVFLSAARAATLESHLEALGRFAGACQARVVIGGRAVQDGLVRALTDHGLEPWPHGRSLDELLTLF